MKTWAKCTPWQKKFSFLCVFKSDNFWINIINSHGLYALLLYPILQHFKSTPAGFKAFLVNQIILIMMQTTTQDKFGKTSNSVPSSFVNKVRAKVAISASAEFWISISFSNYFIASRRGVFFNIYIFFYLKVSFQFIHLVLRFFKKRSRYHQNKRIQRRIIFFQFYKR